MTNVTEIKQKTKQIIKKHKSNKSALIAVLQDIQEANNYLPKEALKTASNMMKVPMSRVYEAATFYTAFSLTPRGKHIVKICKGTACHVRGGARILSELERLLGIKVGEVTPDGKFELNRIACLGCCALEPVVAIDGKFYPRVTPRKLSAILAEYRD